MSAALADLVKEFPMPPRKDDDAHSRRDDVIRDSEIWRAIRASQESAARALGDLAVHNARCDGRYKVIDTKMNAVLWLLGGIAGAAGSSALAYVVKVIGP